MITNVRSCAWFVLCCLAPLPVTAAEPLTIIHAGELLAVPGQPVLQQQSILVKDGAILKVVAGFVNASAVQKADADVRVVDLSNRFVLPGLIDLHVHITMQLQTAIMRRASRPPCGRVSIPSIPSIMPAMKRFN